jgi:Protein of unknown function (DUF2934)
MAKSVRKSSAAPKAAAKPGKPAAKKTVASAKASVNPASHSTNGNSISHDQVAMLANRFWNERGRTHGHHEEDWFRAEQELRSRAS